MLEKRWLKLNDAAYYASIGKHRLIELAQDGKIKGFRDPDSKRGDWIFDRKSLDTYRESQSIQLTAREKALDIMKGLRV